METYRLKNIAIAILLLLNGCLLLLLGHQRLQSLRAERRAEEQLRLLYENNRLSLDGEIDLSQQPLGPLNLARSVEAEQSIASMLLGGSAMSTSQGGGIYSYESNERTIQFRAGGSFYGSRLDLPVEDAVRFIRNFCDAFSYGEPEIQLTEGSGSAVAVQLAGGVPVTNCGVEMYFEDGRLASVTGAHVSLQDASMEPGSRMTCVTALIKFLDYRSMTGIVCSGVTGVRCVYQLQSVPSPRLIPVWEIQTDTSYTFYVDCGTGEVYGK